MNLLLGDIREHKKPSNPNVPIINNMPIVRTSRPKFGPIMKVKVIKIEAREGNSILKNMLILSSKEAGGALSFFINEGLFSW